MNEYLISVSGCVAPAFVIYMIAMVFLERYENDIKHGGALLLAGISCLAFFGILMQNADNIQYAIQVYWYWLIPILATIGAGVAILTREMRKELVEWWRTRDHVLLAKAELISAQIESALPADFTKRREVLAIVKHLREEVLPKMLKVKGDKRQRARHRVSFLIGVLDLIQKRRLDDWNNLMLYYRPCIRDAETIGVDIDELDLDDVDWTMVDTPLQLATGRKEVPMRDKRPIGREKTPT